MPATVRVVLAIVFVTVTLFSKTSELASFLQLFPRAQYSSSCMTLIQSLNQEQHGRGRSTPAFWDLRRCRSGKDGGGNRLRSFERCRGFDSFFKNSCPSYRWKYGSSLVEQTTNICSINECEKWKHINKKPREWGSHSGRLALEDCKRVYNQTEQWAMNESAWNFRENGQTIRLWSNDKIESSSSHKTPAILKYRKGDFRTRCTTSPLFFSRDSITPPPQVLQALRLYSWFQTPQYKEQEGAEACSRARPA